MHFGFSMPADTAPGVMTELMKFIDVGIVN